MMWEKVKLGDIATSIQPGPFGSQLHNSDYSESGTPLIMPKDMINGHISHENLIFVGNEHVSRLSRHQVHEGNIMVARKGDVRKCVYITENEDGWMTGSDCLKVALNDAVCFPKFIYYQLRSPYIGKWLETISIGATMPSLNTGLLSGIELVLPPIPIQKRITDILSAYDNLIKNNQKQIKLLEEAAQRLYKEWFVDFRFPGHETMPIINGLPEGWEIADIESHIKICSGFAFSSNDFSDNGKYKLVTIKNVKDGQFIVDNFTRINEIPMNMPKHCILDDGDILLSLTGNVGRVCTLFGHDYLLNQRVAKLQSLYYAFTYCLFRSKYMFKEMNVLANGVAQQNLSPIRAGKIKVLFPNTSIMQKFETIVAPMIKNIVQLNKSILTLASVRDRLLPELITGKIEV